jgi:hypothetical protein
MTDKLSAREVAARNARLGRQRPSAEEIARDTSERFAATIKRLGDGDRTMTDWQPIESAPKDGTEVLVLYMHIKTQCVFNAFYASEEDGWDREDVGWWSYEHSEVSRIKLEGFMKPTHWMPLPAPPKDEE